jgi:quercetin dioxygenase-like cupin family protein
MVSEPIADPVLRQRYRFAREGDRMTIEIEIDPGGHVPKHYHPGLRERWEVIEGEVTFEVGRHKQRPRPGEKLVVEPGVRHSFENTGDVTALVRAEAQPALEIQGFLVDGAALNREGKVTPRGVPTSFGALLEASAFVERYAQTTVVLFAPPAPPRLLQRLIVPPLARLHRRRLRREPQGFR